MFGKESNGLLIEGDERFRTQPTPLIGDESVCKIPTGVQKSKSSLDCWSIEGNIRCISQGSDGGCYFFTIEFVQPAQYPDKLA